MIHLACGAAAPALSDVTYDMGQTKHSTKSEK